MSKTYYVVSGQLSYSSKTAASFHGKPWFSEIGNRKFRSLTTYVNCDTLKHALVQYNRLQRGTRQIDRRGPGIREVFRHD